MKGNPLKTTLLFLGSILFVLFFRQPVMGNGQSHGIRSWLCYYGTDYGPETYSRFDLVVLDGHHHPPLEHTSPGRPILLGYLSFGEVDIDGPFWTLAKGKPFLVKKNEFWNSWIVDIRNPAWEKLLFDVAIPQIFKKGFDGLFLDTLDSSLELLEDDGKDKFKGIEPALKRLIKKIKTKYPKKCIAVNRGLPALPIIAPYIDVVVIEDLYSYYAGHEKRYQKVDPEVRRVVLGQVETGLKVNPELTILSLDYAAVDQADLAREAINYSKKRGFIPYVSTYELNRVFFYTLGN